MAMGPERLQYLEQHRENYLMDRLEEIIDSALMTAGLQIDSSEIVIEIGFPAHNVQRKSSSEDGSVSYCFNDYYLAPQSVMDALKRRYLASGWVDFEVLRTHMLTASYAYHAIKLTRKLEPIIP